MKERLTGAIILVALIVLLVPELLTGPIRTRSAPDPSRTAASPSAVGDADGPMAHPQPPLRSYTLTLGATPPPRDALATPAAQSSATPALASAGTSAPGPVQSGAAAPASSEGQQQATAPRTAASPAAAPHAAKRTAIADPGLQASKSPAHEVVREARTPASSGGWVVQLGSFASRGNADRLARSLAGRGFHMSVSAARTRSRVLWRVRAGPVRDRAGAERLAARLRARGHRGEILPVR
ncbi:MAG TPA: SPOR domain-containing protein [Steroidobacteraceae bacterium]|nr:SPOR domain-containing protein [Steroidobacteraceae bacterium]